MRDSRRRGLVAPLVVLAAGGLLLWAVSSASGSPAPLVAIYVSLSAMVLWLWRLQRDLRQRSAQLRVTCRQNEQEKAELEHVTAQAADSLRRLDGALAAGGTGTFIWHVRANQWVADGCLASLLELSPEEQQGITRERFAQSMPESDAEALVRQIEQCLANGPDVCATFAWTRAGATVQLRCRARVERDPEGIPLRLVGTLADRTYEVQAEEAQRRVERRMRRFLEALPLGVFVEDRLGRTYYANTLAKSLLLGDAECAGALGAETSTSLDNGHSSVSDTLGGAARACLKLTMTHRGESSLEDVQLDTVQGHRTIRVWGVPIDDELGERVEFAMAVLQDVTELKQLELERNQGQKLEAIGQLAAGIAHEINTPTQYVSDNTHFMETAFKRLSPFLDAAEAMVAAKKADEVTDEHFAALKKAGRKAKLDFVRREVPKAITQSIEGLERVATIVRAMKEFSHPGGGGMSPTDLNRAVQTTVTVARSEWKYVADVELALADDLPNVPALPDELNQVILNIVVNAAHAIREKLGEDSTEKGTITIATRLCEDHAEIIITDDGVGVPEAIQARVFDPFFTTKPVGKGTGQGLAIARKVMLDGHHGDLRLVSAEGEGASFTLMLPLTQPETAERAPEAAE